VTLTSRSIVVDHLEKRVDSQNCGIAYIYFDSQDQEHQTALNVFSSLLKQLAVRSKQKSLKLNNMHSRHQARGTRPDLTEIVDCIISVCTLFSANFIILDALDESDESCRPKVLKELSRLLESKSVKVLATGRPHIPVLENFEFSSTKQVRADIHDLRHYLENKLNERTLSEKLKERIVAELLAKANGL
jgi:hypothetical protein